MLAEARALQPRTLELRRALHRHPEIGLMLPATQAAVLAALEDLPLEVGTGRECSSVVAVLRGARPGPSVLVRADMDALPMHEDTGLPFSSEVDGAMHSCGHDLHTAMLASTARLLAGRRDRLAGTVVLMFQPGEESSHGARMMIDEGLLSAEGPGGTPESAMALHVTSRLAAGTLQTRPDSIMASSDDLHVTVTGRGGHASAPHDALDPVPAAAAMVGALQTMVTRRVSAFDPAVLTVAHISAGTTTNVIPETAMLEGTVRTLSEETRARVLDEVTRVCTGVADAYGCTCEVEIEAGYPVTVNDPDVADRVADAGRSVLGSRFVEPMPDPIMGSEDFSYVLGRVPGALAFLGACPADVDPAEAPPNHSNRVVFDEDAMVAGVALYSGYVLDALRRA
ncbi:M20 metallopeptidase family protein [Actinomycetospora callitridis]|uniref:M20 metallopeptidase family protein n=1 Tax=Actinomycetospora callitridis TaxID=913944 RepID=UPI0023671F96|nr:M20 family metallopeptidase [Actinomycetospora callitridis]MDD7920932.1 M20 family metallopeptidase [Actinomycetospora callitridis]